MTWLDCGTQENALSTVAAAAEVPEDRLAAAIIAGEPDHSGDSQVDPIDSFPRDIFRQFGIELEGITLDGALLFHGTRLADPDSVMREGLQPLGQRLEAIWEMLGRLARPESDKEDWRYFRDWVENGGGGDDGCQYRLKTNDEMHHGPFTVLVRDVLTRPHESYSHDYLDCPEIVQDICRCFSVRDGIDLEARFKAATEPCVVTVRQSPVSSEAIGTAVWFIRAELLGRPVGLACAGGPVRPRGAIAPEEVVAVDVYR
jgi:hypothetical protein